MTWEAEIAEISKRKEFAKARGGAEGVARQRRRGKLLVNERLDGLLDPGSLREFMSLVGRSSHDDSGELVGFTPKARLRALARSTGARSWFGRRLYCSRRLGAAATARAAVSGSEKHSNQRALEWRVPYVRMLDSAGGSVRGFETLGRTYLPDGNTWSTFDMESCACSPWFPP